MSLAGFQRGHPRAIKRLGPFDDLFIATVVVPGLLGFRPLTNVTERDSDDLPRLNNAPAAIWIQVLLVHSEAEVYEGFGFITFFWLSAKSQLYAGIPVGSRDVDCHAKPNTNGSPSR